MIGKRRRNRYKFTEKKQSKMGIAALCGAMISEIFYLCFIYAACQNDGSLSLYFASAGILMLAIAIVTLGFGIKSLFDDDSFKTFPRLAVIMSLIAIASWVGTYVFGAIL